MVKTKTKVKTKIDLVSKQEKSAPINKKWFWRSGKKVLLGTDEYYDDVSDVII